MRDSSKAWLGAVLAVGALAGCAPRPHPATTTPAPARLDAATVDMITGSGAYPERYHRVDVADVELTRRCAAAAGFTWAGQAGEVNPQAKDGGAVSLDYVRHHGYGLSDDPPPAEKAGPVADETALQTAVFGPPGDKAEMRSPNGVVFRYPQHGCAARAHTAIYGDLGTWARIVDFPQEFNLRLSAAAKADPRYAGKQIRWRDCMAAEHYSYDSSDAIVARLTEAYRTDRRPLTVRRAAEIKIALADVSCDERVRLSATALQLRREYAQQIPPAGRAELAHLSTLFDAAERRAAALPAGESAS